MPETRADASQWIALEDHWSAHNYHPLDVVIARGEGIWVWDVEGKKYLDFLAAYSALNQGYGHPRIVEALTRQAKELALTSRAFRNDRFGPFCRKLSQLLGYDKTLMMNTGAEAVETAVKACRRWGYRSKGVPAGEAEIIVFDGNFHGRTTTIISFSTDEGARGDFGPYTPGFRVAPYGDVEATRAMVNDRTVAILVEPIQGEGGVVIPPADFLPGLRALCDERKVLLICDEIQSGLGRAGSLLAHTLSGIRADGVTIGKALSGGLYPVSAFLADDAVMDVFDPGSHGSTYGGNPLACAVAEAAMDVLVEEGLVEHSARLGVHLEERLRAIEVDFIEEIRVAGLWAGIQFSPSVGGARKISEALQAKGLLCKETHVHTLRLAPPLVIKQEELDMALDIIEGVLLSL
ncbi:MAG: ornithine--oxo-acid transaminase [Planctomycetota bacterium]|jgi:ornithine--oxo-acid transaminase